MPLKKTKKETKKGFSTSIQLADKNKTGCNSIGSLQNYKCKSWYIYIYIYIYQLLLRRRVIYGILEHSFLHSWISPFPGLRLVASLRMRILVYIYICSPIVCCLVSWCLRHPHWRNANVAKGILGFCWMHVGCGPASGPTLKKALCHTCLVVGWRINKAHA